MSQAIISDILLVPSDSFPTDGGKTFQDQRLSKVLACCVYKIDRERRTEQLQNIQNIKDYTHTEAH